MSSKVEDRDMDRLVELIARRVEGALSVSGPRAHGEAPCGACGVRGACDKKVVQAALETPGTRVGANPGLETAPCAYVAPLIDHTLLKPEATRDEVKQLCEEARRYGFATVCLNSENIRLAAALLEGSSVKPIAVVGFPLGAGTTGAKAFETREAIRNGAQEIDMVINIGALKSKDYLFALEDIKGVVEAAGRVPVKVILETSKLTRDEKVIACALSKAAGAAFVKTSTGFGGGGATAEDIELMREVVGEEMGVKASGGVRTIDDVEAMVRAGANRIGASSSVAIVQCERGDKAKSKGY